MVTKRSIDRRSPAGVDISRRWRGSGSADHALATGRGHELTELPERRCARRGRTPRQTHRAGRRRRRQLSYDDPLAVVHIAIDAACRKQCDSEAGTDHLDNRRQARAPHLAAAVVAGELTDGERLVAKTVAFFEQNEPLA